VRLIAATNKNLEDLVKAGTFRDDLFFRLRVVKFTYPRCGNERAMFRCWRKISCASSPGKTTSDARIYRRGIGLLMNHSWPGNVRELRTAIEHAVVLCRGEKVTARDLPPWVRAGAEATTADPTRMLAKNDLTVKEAEKQLIIRALKETNGNAPLPPGKSA
jgi:DNA-binding NtrC family response regulator